MGMGYFISQMFSEALEDGPLFRKCVRDIMNDKDGPGGLYIPACRQVYLNWLESGKWKEYATDIAVMITSGKVAELINRGAAAAIGRTYIGSYFLRVGFIPFAGPALIFASAFYTFLEVNGLLDKYVGNPIKKHLLINDMVMDIRTLNEGFSELERGTLNLLTGQDKNFALKAVNSADRDQTAREDLKWMAETDEGKEFWTAVISRLNPKERQTLDRRLQVTAMKRVQRIGGGAVNWESPEEEEDPTLRDMIILRAALLSFTESEENSKRLPGRDKLMSLHREIQDLREDLVSRIQTIGFRFARWALVEGRGYQEAFFFWKNKTDKTTVSYIAAEDFLKELYESSQSIEQLREEMKQEISLITEKREARKYSENKEAEEDYYDRELKETRARYNRLIRNRLEFFTFYENRIAENRDIYISRLCPYLEDPDILIQTLYLSNGSPGWPEWCENPETRLDPRFLVYQTTPVLNAVLQKKFPAFYNDSSYDGAELLRVYLSHAPDELFADGNFIGKNYSGDIQTGALSLERADLPTKTLIARAFLSALNSFPLTEGQNPPVSETAWKNMLEVSCFVEEDPVKCRSLAEKALREKLAAGAFSLLKELLNAPPQSSDISAKDRAEQEKRPGRGFALTDFAEVYKGPEKRFAEDTTFASTPEKNVSPYTFLHDFICGDPAGSVNKEGRFAAPQMFPELSSVCDFLNENKTDTYEFSTDRDPAVDLRNRYFHTPVTIGQTLYPSVYEAVEAQIINRFYKSERKKEALFEEFGRLTEPAVLTATQTLREDLQKLRADYIVPGLINKTAVDKTQCHALRDYYGMESYKVTEIPRGLFRDPLRIDYLEEQVSAWRGLEIYLFQVHFWLERIRAVHHITEGKDLKSFDPSAEPADNIICVVLELLKSYHDSYTEGGSSLVYLTREETEKIKGADLPRALTDISTKSINNGNRPALLPPSLMFSLILKALAPGWEDRFRLVSGVDFEPETKQEAVLHALITELKKSLDGFYLTLSLLNLPDSVDEAAHRRMSGGASLSE